MPYDELFQVRIPILLARAFDTHLKSVYSGRLYENTPTSPTPAFPYAIYQSQDGGGKRKDSIGQNGWTGLITFRSIDTTLSGAKNKALELAQEFANVTVSGYSILITSEHPLSFPVERSSTGSIYTAGLLTRIEINPN